MFQLHSIHVDIIFMELKKIVDFFAFTLLFQVLPSRTVTKVVFLSLSFVYWRDLKNALQWMGNDAQLFCVPHRRHLQSW
jgi:hypothetical protein